MFRGQSILYIPCTTSKHSIHSIYYIKGILYIPCTTSKEFNLQATSPFVLLVQQLSRNQTLLFCDIHYTSDGGQHTQRQTLAEGWQSPSPTSREQERERGGVVKQSLQGFIMGGASQIKYIKFNCTKNTNSYLLLYRQLDLYPL